jgi:tRNA(fMet)-specific endonuclease VapC
MVILDTNHFSELERGSAPAVLLRQRMTAYHDLIAMTIITAQESSKGWLHAIQSNPKDRFVYAYSKFQEGLLEFADWTILGWTDDAADIFDDLRSQQIKIGTLDLRIASIALEYKATVLTRNFSDFKKVPGLLVENWLD